MTDILELAKRVEALDGPCREVDREIRKLFGHAWDRLNASTGIKESNPVANPYTASIDVAMTLVPEGWWCSQLSFAETWGRCTLQSPHYTYVRSESGSPALAMVAAALRATNGQ